VPGVLRAPFNDAARAAAGMPREWYAPLAAEPRVRRGRATAAEAAEATTVAAAALPPLA
jgi:hypothetical protein